MPWVAGLLANTARRLLVEEGPTEATPSTSPTAMETMVSTTPGASAMPSTFKSVIVRLPSGSR